MKHQAKITVGMTDRRTEITGHMGGNLRGHGFSLVSGRFPARVDAEMIVLNDEASREIYSSINKKLRTHHNF